MFITFLTVYTSTISKMSQLYTQSNINIEKKKSSYYNYTIYISFKNNQRDITSLLYSLYYY